jgi:hypothetical protein
VNTRDPRPFAVYGFATTHDALAAEAAAKEAGLPVTPIPAPRELGSLCGIALRFELPDASRAEAVFVQSAVAWTARAEILDV